MKIREYRGPLTVLGAGAVGFSLFIIVSAAAMSGPNVSSTPIALQPQDLVDSAVSNINTMAALTVESISEFIPTATISPLNTSTLTQTEVPTNTPSLIPTRTRIPPTLTRTRDSSIVVPTSTRPPTRTFTPAPTNTPLPPPTDTNTPEPPPTDTNTPEPPPTNTEEPPPTSTSEPPPTIEPIVTIASTEGVGTDP